MPRGTRAPRRRPPFAATRAAHGPDRGRATGGRRPVVRSEIRPRRFGYYERLTRAQQRVYRQSDGVTSLRLPGAGELRPLVDGVEAALRSEDRPAVQAASQALFTGLTRAFAVGPCRVEVLAARPHGRWGELQGLYTEDRRGRAPRVQLWMRTARQRRVVAFRTYLRTLLHELCHHLDYRHLRLADSFHTQGFYQRESSLFHQLVPRAEEAPASPAPDGAVPF